MQVDELAPGLWRWTAEHPAWEPGQGWEREVACFYAETTVATVLVDPLVPDGEERERLLRHLDADVERRGVPAAVVLTGEWHRRSADELATRYGARVHPYHDPPPGVELAAVAGAVPLLWVPELRALAVGDALISLDGGLRLWGARDDAAAVRAVLELPVEHVLVAHGDHVPGGRDAIAAALEQPAHA